jgi:DNA-binding transcriptional LysR family regulator
MDLHHLRTFVVVAEERSFTKAAARLYISQPPLSRHVRQLEDILGVRLLARNRQKVELTAEGRFLLAKAKAVVDAADDVVKAADQLRAGATGALKVGLASGMWNVALAVRSNYARNSTSSVIVDVANISSTEQADALLARRIDVGLMHGKCGIHSLLSERLFDEHIVAMLPAAHPLASADSVTLSALARETVIVSKSTLSDHVVSMYARANVTPAEIVECPRDFDVDAVRMMVASGRAIHFALESPWTTSARVAGISTVRVNEPNAQLPVHVSWRKGEQSAAILSFVNCARMTFLAAETGAASAPFFKKNDEVLNRLVPEEAATELIAQTPAVFSHVRSAAVRRLVSVG